MPDGINYQPRDLAVLSEIGEVGILDQDLIRERHFLPKDKSGALTPKKLRQYVDVGLLQKFKLRDLLVFRLTQLGIEEVERLTGCRPKRAGINDPPSELTIYHRMGTIRTRFYFDDACEAAKFPSPDWIMEYDPEPRAVPTKPKDEQLLLCEYFSDESDQRIRFRPDLAGCFTFPGDTPWQLCAYFEFDRSTMSHKKVLAKVRGWTLAIKRNLQNKYWPGLERRIVRVLFLCKSDARVINLMDDFRETEAAPYLRITTEEQLRQTRDLFTRPIWHCADGEIRPILKGKIRRGQSK